MPSPLSPIRVGWDGDAQSMDALLLGRNLATASGGEIEVVHVDTGTPPSGDLTADLRAAFDPETTPRSSTLSDRSAALGLARLAADSGALVLGSTRRGGIGRVAPGSVAVRLLGHVRCPLGIAPTGYAGRPEAADRLRVIDVGFDGSRTSQGALSVACELAAGSGAALRVIAVGHPTPADLRGAPAGHRSEAVGPPDLQEQLIEAVRDLASSLRALPLYERGDSRQILRDQAALGVDLLVIGSRAHSRVGAAVLGSTARALVKTSPCPVLVVPPA